MNEMTITTTLTMTSRDDPEEDAIRAVREFARENRELLQYIARWGDGAGGYIAVLIAEELGLTRSVNSTQKPHKGVKVSRGKRDAVIDLHGRLCLACKTDKDICMDHVVPLTKGGKNTVDNLQPLCRSCNSTKGVKSTDYRKSNAKRVAL